MNFHRTTRSTDIDNERLPLDPIDRVPRDLAWIGTLMCLWSVALMVFLIAVALNQFHRAVMP